MIFCPRCFHKINRERHDLGDGFKCPSCRQMLDNTNAICALGFPDCVTNIRYVGLNTVEDANLLLKMMQG
jgi:hypothetical protein